MTEPKSTNIKWHSHQVTGDDLEKLNGHKGCTVWFTGLSGSGKSTLANAVALELHKRKVNTYVLDGDNIRHGLNKDLGFAKEDREENIRRIGEVAKLFTCAGIVNLTAFVSPFKSDRKIARDLQPTSFVEVYCHASLDVCEKRDPKGLYKKARAGQIKGFTGIDAPYELPKNPELKIDTGKQSIEDCATIVVNYLASRKIV